MENDLREEFNVLLEAKRQQEIIINLLSLSGKMLEILRGPIEEEKCEGLNANCLLNIIKINTTNLRDLEKNFNEIIRNIMG